ncbi:hypothetical protein GGS26DRAFT_592509 [Hypomontagnella submonticulosa]|nr:hypothetical protein GGS26DRAFT_592509 [Hypomontagnella submonticulosa]
MKGVTVVSILLAITNFFVGAVPPFMKDRDSSVDALGWNSSSPLSPRQPISPPSHLHIPILLPEGHVGRRPRAHLKVNEVRRADLPTSPPEQGTPDHPHSGKCMEIYSPDGTTPDSGAPSRTPLDSPATEPTAAMAGLAIALSASVALLI